MLKINASLNNDCFQAKRVGQKNNNANDKLKRPILVSFNNCWDRKKLYMARMKLRSAGLNKVFINEDLTKNQSELFFHARKAKQNKRVHNTWTNNGSVFIRLKKDTEEMILKSVEDLAKVSGYVPKL